MKRLTPLVLSLFVLGLPACDITIEDGGGDTDGSGDSGDEDDDNSDDDDGGESGDSGDSGDDSAGDDDSGNDSGSDDDSGDSGNDSGSDDDSGDSGESGESGESGSDDDSGDSGNDSGSDDDSGDSGDDSGSDDDSGDSGGAVCDEEPSCQACYDCATSPSGSCNDVAVACADNEDCVEMSFCFDDCGANSVTQEEYDACLLDCEQEWAAGVDPFVDLLECTFDQECSSACM